jgi:hypothetical protein
MAEVPIEEENKVGVSYCAVALLILLKLTGLK